MSQYLDKLEKAPGVPVLIGVALVVLNLIVRLVLYFVLPPGEPVNFLLFLLTDANLLLHLGIAVSVIGLLVGDVL
ncbi:MAG TPA: hypothetical protein VLC95_04950 [Anaerolineae bacterium]|jgi:hypothetical protein|nr:hypothetical protein [Anaerolineae bacterium]